MREYKQAKLNKGNKMKMEKENEKVEYEDLLCPKCNSDEFDYIDETNFLDNPSVVYFECKSCGCSFSALRHIQYSKVSAEKSQEDKNELSSDR